MKGHIYPIVEANSFEDEFEDEDRRGLKDRMRSFEDEFEDEDRRGLKDRMRFLSGRVFFLGFFGLGLREDTVVSTPSSTFIETRTRPLFFLL